MLRTRTSETAKSLVAALAEVLREIPSDPLTPEVVSVPTRGIERWISQELAQRLGSPADDSSIAANISYPSPYRLVSEVLAATAGTDDGADPWSRDDLVWPVLAALDANLDEPWILESNNWQEGKDLLPEPVVKRVRDGDYWFKVVPVDAEKFKKNYNDTFWASTAQYSSR